MVRNIYVCCPSRTSWVLSQRNLALVILISVNHPTSELRMQELQYSSCEECCLTPICQSDIRRHTSGTRCRVLRRANGTDYGSPH